MNKNLPNLQNFVQKSILKNDLITKTVYILGTINESNSILILENLIWNNEAIDSIINSKSQMNFLSNDVYWTCNFNNNQDLKITLIHPCDQTVI